MYFFIYFLLGTLVPLICWFLDARLRKHRLAVIAGSVLVGLISGWIGWRAMPTFAWNFQGNWFLLALIGLIGVLPGIFIHLNSYGHKDPAGPFAKLAWLPLIVTSVMLIPVYAGTTWAIFHDTEYRALVGNPVESEFSADVAPIDIRQVRTVDQALAKELGSKRIEEDSGLGSRVRLGTMNIQTINGCFGILDGDGEVDRLCFENQLVWVGPLEHIGSWKAYRNVTTPGYVIVSATDSSQVQLVAGLSAAEADAAEQIALRYLSSGVFGNWGHRHVRTNGYATAGLMDYSFEIDDTGQPYWVVTQFDRTIGFDGADPIGVVVVDVQTGAIAEYDIASAPEWIDRIQPEAIVIEQLDNWGEYVHGYFNAWFLGNREDIVQTTPGMSLVYGSDGKSYWYSGMQSSGADTGTNSFVLVNTRNGEFRRYDISGFNETAARRAAESAQGIAEAGYQGTSPILYNIGGEPSYFLGLKGDGGLVKAFAFVSLANAEIVGVGGNPTIALRSYQNALISNNRGLSSQGVAEFDRIDGVIAGVVQIGDAFYLLFEDDSGREFIGTNDISPELKWAEPGMIATVFFQDGSDTTQQIFRFDLPGLNLSVLSSGVEDN